MIRVIVPFARILIAASPRTPRALGSGEIVSCVHTAGGRAVEGVDTANCLEIARNEVRTNETIVVTGSHYVVGEVFEHIGIVP
jgi:folylpolyglutamate synthase/dihydropteroate synthase